VRGRTRVGLAATIVATALGAGGTAAGAQEPVALPAVAVTMSPAGITAAGAEALSAGPTSFTFSSTDTRRQRFGVLVELYPGKTPAQWMAAAARGKGAGKVGRVIASATQRVKASARRMTVPLKPRTRYALAMLRSTTPAGKSSWFATGFATATTSTGLVAPTPAATVVMRDFRFTGASVLPRTGVIRFQNAGKYWHGVGAMQLRASATAGRLRAALRAFDATRALRRLTQGGLLEINGIIDAAAVTDVDVVFPSAGRYLLISSQVLSGKADHQRGMYRIVTVR
jgi:hypothetical protein